LFQDLQNAHHKLNRVQQPAEPREKVLQRRHANTSCICARAPESFDGRVEKNGRCGGLVMD
jgi:hypothetical protein